MNDHNHIDALKGVTARCIDNNVYETIDEILILSRARVLLQNLVFS